MTSARTKLPRYSNVCHPTRGEPYTVLRYITQEVFDDALTYTALPGDVFVCAYPKCGTTWVLHALYTLRSGGVPMTKEQDIDAIFPFLELDGREKVEAVEESPRIIKSHLGPDMIPWHPEAKYIALGRNPKDVFTSFYYHTIGFEKAYDFVGGKFYDYFELAIKGNVDSGDYFTCAPDWWKKSKEQPNVLFILYEDVLEDPSREFLKIAKFLGPDFGEKATANDNDILKKMVNGSSFKNMKDATIKSRTRPTDIPFTRKGVVGDWKNLMTKEQSERVDKKMQETRRIYPGFDRLWDKYQQRLAF